MSRFAKIVKLDQEAVKTLSESYELGHHDDFTYAYKSERGLTAQMVSDLSKRKNEPDWMRELRLRAFGLYQMMPMPNFGGDLSQVKWEEIYYYLAPTKKESKTWEEVPDAIKKTFDKIGVPQAEQGMLSGVKAQYDSEVIYGSLRKSLSKKGVVFLGMDDGLARYPELVKEYFSKIVPLGDNKLAALNSAVWSGGSFIYIPKNVEVELPLQAYFRINSENAGQFERTLIIADEGSKVHYVEGCSAPAYSSGSLHAAVVEIMVKKGARVQYTTVQNWYKNVYNLVTKRAYVEEEGEMRWIDGNLGCLVGETMVSTVGGYKRIDEIKPGQLIYTLNSAKLGLMETPVIAWKHMGKKKTFRIKTRDGRSILATDNHPFLKLAKRKGAPVFELSWTRLDGLKKGDFVAVLNVLPENNREHNLDPLEIGKRSFKIPKIGGQIDEDLMWFLGAYIGDGCLDGTSRVNLAIPENDKAFPRIKLILEKWGLSWSRHREVTMRIGSKYLVDLLASLEIKGSAKTKAIPEWIFGLPVRMKLAFIEGYLDTDGHIRGRKIVNGKQLGQIIFASANLALLEQLKLLMYGCGLETKNISRYVKDRVLYKNILKEYISYYLSMNLDGNLNIIRSKVTPENSFRFEKIVNIEEDEERDVYDIEVKDGESFVANGILVHNSKLTMKYPACILAGRKARGETLSIAMAGSGQHQDAGAKMIHLAPETTSQIISKSISKNGGRASYRGLIKINKGAKGARSKVVCDALILDSLSRSDTYPTNIILENEVSLEHEATVSKVGEDQLFYLMSRGLPEHEAEAMIVNGFLEPVMKQIPLEYAVEMNRLVELEMEGSVG